MRFLKVNCPPEQLRLSPVSRGSVRITELTTPSCGSATPKLWQNLVPGPARSTTVSQTIEPFFVTTAEMRPAVVSGRAPRIG